MTSKKHGRIAFITTPKFREHRKVEARKFIYQHLYSLCQQFDVISTQRTYNFILETIENASQVQVDQEINKHCTTLSMDTDDDLDKWNKCILDKMRHTKAGYPGMIHIANDLVEGRINAIIHLTDWEDKTAKADSAVLSC